LLCHCECPHPLLPSCPPRRSSDLFSPREYICDWLGFPVPGDWSLCRLGGVCPPAIPRLFEERGDSDGATAGGVASWRSEQSPKPLSSRGQLGPTPRRERVRL